MALLFFSYLFVIVLHLQLESLLFFILYDRVNFSYLSITCLFLRAIKYPVRSTNIIQGPALLTRSNPNHWSSCRAKPDVVQPSGGCLSGGRG